MPSASTTLTIQNKLGLHARPAMAFVDAASRFNADIRVARDGQEVDGKSVMQLMMLAATCGSELKITAQGDDADDALAELTRLVEGGFDEE